MIVEVVFRLEARDLAEPHLSRSRCPIFGAAGERPELSGEKKAR